MSVTTAKGIIALALAAVAWLPFSLDSALAQGMHSDGTPVGKENERSLKGPIKPSGYITDKGVIIPKHEGDNKEAPKAGPGPAERYELKNNLMPGLSVDFGMKRPEQGAGQGVWKGITASKEKTVPPFVSKFQIQDARKLEDEYKIIFPKSPLSREEIKKEKEKKGWGNLVAMYFPLGSRKPKWKYLGIREISGERKAVWQTAIVVKNVKGIGISFTKANIPLGSQLITYGLSTTEWDTNYSAYFLDQGRHTTGLYRGDTVIVEYHAVNAMDNIDINSFIEIESVSQTIGDPRLSSDQPIDMYARGAPDCGKSMCLYTILGKGQGEYPIS